MLYEWIPNQHPFPYPTEGDIFGKISTLVEKVEPVSLRKLIFETVWALIFRNPRPRYVVSTDQTAEIVKRCLDEEYKFAKENELRLACFYAKRRDLLMFLASYQPDYLEKDYPEKKWGYLQRRILVLRYKSKFWIFLPKP